jgi:hypothetical protein
MSRQEFSESYLGFGKWHIHGEDLPVTPAKGQPKATYNGIITTAAAAGDFDVTHRDNASVEALAVAKKVIIKPPNGIVSIEFRFRFNGTAGDQHVLQKFLACGDDFYDLVDVLTIDQGTQQHTSGAAGTGIKFIDTVVSAGEKWLTDTRQLSDTVNHIGRDTQNMHKYDRIWFVASTLDTANSGTTLYIDWKEV